MNNDYPTYHNHDIEWFLQNKDFDALTEGEQSFVLSQIDSPEEYAEMRHTLSNIRMSFGTEEVLEPELTVKDTLFAEFDRVHGKQTAGSGRTSWWNTLFPQNKSLFFSPGFQLAGLALIIVGLSFLFTSNNDKNENIALHKNDNVVHPTTIEEASPLESVTDSSEDKSEERISPSPAISHDLDNNHASGEMIKATEKEAAREMVVDMQLNDEYKSTVMDSVSSFAFAKGNSSRSENLNQNTQSTAKTDDAVFLMETSVEQKKAVTTDSRKKTSAKESYTKAEEGASSTKTASTGVEQEKSGKDKNESTIGVNAAKNPELLELLFTAL